MNQIEVLNSVYPVKINKDYLVTTQFEITEQSDEEMLTKQC